MSTLDRHVLARGLRLTAVIGAAVFGILVGGQAAVFLGRGAPPEALGELLLPLAVFAAPLVIPLAISAAVMAVIGEMHRSGQLQALGAAGLSPLRAARALWPLVLGGALLAGVLAHSVLPGALAGLREGRERFLGTAVELRVAQRRPIDLEQGRIWAGDAERGRLRDLVVSIRDADGSTLVFAPSGRWRRHQSATGADQPTLVLDRAVALRQAAGGGLTRIDTGRLTLVQPADADGDETRRDHPETWATGRLWQRWRAGPPQTATRSEAWLEFNNAALALHTRLFLPVSVVALSLLAVGLALALRRGEALLAIAIMAVATLASVQPAVAYIKSGTRGPKSDPLWLLLPPALLMLAVAVVLIRRAGRPGALLPRAGA